MKFAYPGLLFILILPLFISCVNTRQATYFDIQKDSITQIQYPSKNLVIQKNDILSISVSSLSQEASQVFNVSNSAGGSGSGGVLGGYLVNDEGNIQLPVIGNVKAAGLTKEELQQSITKQLVDKKLLLDPTVIIRSLNYRVTVLGEVGKPSVINVPSEKISILEAIGFAGDMTLYANRSDVLVMREENGKREFKLLNLNSNEVFNSPYFYLKPNDVVYIKPNKTRVASVSNTRQWLPTIFSALSLISIISYRLTQ